MGKTEPNPFGNVGAASKRGYDYQHFVCPWHNYNPASNVIDEWQFAGVNFDGLHPEECHLYETKNGYEGFLEQHDWTADGRPVLRSWAKNAFGKMLNQADRQRAVVAPHYPDVRLTWVFASMMTHLYVNEIFLRRRWAPPIDTEVRPFVEGNGDEQN